MRHALLLALAAAACGNPDNLVIGGISSKNGSPPVILNEPKSAIHGRVQLTDPKGAPLVYVTAIVLSNVPDLCTAIAQKPDFFRNPSIDFVALVITAPDNLVGTFTINGPNPEIGYTEALAGHANLPTQATFQAYAGYAALTNLDLHGEANGSFDFIFVDGGGNGAELSGRYKTRACGALTQAALP